jgi:hypothetical protein
MKGGTPGAEALPDALSDVRLFHDHSRLPVNAHNEAEKFSVLRSGQVKAAEAAGNPQLQF